MKLKQAVKVKNELGLHIRPAAAIVKILQTFKSNVYFQYKKEKINARSIMSILTLIAKKNSLITIIVEGEDAKKAMNALLDGFNSSFGER